MSNTNTRFERNQDATVYVGNLAPEVEEDILYELMVQVAPVSHIKLPKDKISKTHQGFAFIEFKSPRDVEYVTKVINGVMLFGRHLKINKAKSDDSTPLIDVGAILYLGNLDKLIDENFLMETFKQFGAFVKPPMIVRDPLTKESKGYGFLYFDSFENSDKVLEQMNNQYLMNRPVKIDYALKKNGKHGERHGDSVERLLAQNAKENNLLIAKEATKLKQKEDEFVKLERRKGNESNVKDGQPNHDNNRWRNNNNNNSNNHNNHFNNSSNRGNNYNPRGSRGRGATSGYNHRGYSPYK